MANIAKITVNSTNYDLKDTLARNHLSWYGTCSSEASAETKVVSCANYELVTGGIIAVKFDNTNSASTSSLALNINSTGAKAVKYRGNVLASADIISSGSIINFLYDGTNYEIVGFTDTTYESKTAASGGTDVSLVTTGEKFIWNNQGQPVYFVEGSGSDAEGVWTGTIPNLTAYYNGLTVIYLPRISLSTSQGATLNINNLGAYPCRINNRAVSMYNYTELAPILFTFYNNVWTKSDLDTTYSVKSATYLGTQVSLVTTGEKYKWNNKVDKVSNATNGHFAGLDSSGCLTDSGSSASDFLTSHQNIKQDGILGTVSNNTNTVSRFVTCTTASSTADKTGDIKTGTFSLQQGAFVIVRFTNENTADNPTLNINSTGAKSIYSKNSKITTGSNKSLLKGVVGFVYDGIQYNLIGNYIDTTYESKPAVSGGTDLSLVTTGEKYSWSNASGGVSGNINSIWYATCSTATTVNPKEITISRITSQTEIVPGMLFIVYFPYGFSSVRSNFQLRINEYNSSLGQIHYRDYILGAPTDELSMPTSGYLVLYYDGHDYYELNDPMSQWLGWASSDNNSLLMNQSGLIKPVTTIPDKYNLKPIVYSASTPPSTPTTGMVWLKQAPISLEEAQVLILSTTASSLPTTITDSAIKSDMVVLKSELGSPSAQASDLTVTTSAGSLTIAGTLSGSTTITLYLLRSR